MGCEFCVGVLRLENGLLGILLVWFAAFGFCVFYCLLVLGIFVVFGILWIVILFCG